MKDSILIVDGNSLLFRAFHALPLMDAEGVYTNAVHGFLMMLLKAAEDFSPTYCAVAFDEKKPTFRHEQYNAYKAGRAPTPPELSPQFDYIKEILTAMGLGVLTLPGFEADDILGTAARRANEQGLHAYLLTGDRDALQLVSKDTSLLFTKKGISELVNFTPAKVKEVYGITPEQVTDWKGMMGDASDNIPGIKGVGEKTAVKLLETYGTLENTLAHADEIKGKLGEKVREGKNSALFSKMLATIRTDAPIKITLEAWSLNDMASALPVLDKYRLSTIQEKVRKRCGVTVPAPAPTVQAVWAEIADTASLRRRLDDLSMTEPLALHVSEQAVTLMQQGTALRIPLSAGQQSLLDTASGLTLDDLVPLFDALSSHPALILHDAKTLMHLLRRQSLPMLAPWWDTAIAAYLLSPNEKSYTPDALGQTNDAAGVLALCQSQRPALEDAGMERLFFDVEMPLINVLFQMEVQGFAVDGQTLRMLLDSCQSQTEQLQQTIFDQIGHGPFNINSPRQLGDMLFDRLKLPARKKTATGYSTDAATLEGLLEHHPVIGSILMYRQLTKLQSTYLEPMLHMRDAEGRIHTTFVQTTAATGRISSVEPNLQNIPVRSEAGREIRKAFVASPGHILIDGDYSQIELRILAHMSGDEAMRDAFIQGQDIHQRTASEVFRVPMDAVTPAMRAQAKAVNFGIVYGISDFGLARNLNMNVKEAGQFIRQYLDTYHGVADFMENAKRLGHEKGYAQTLMGRRRPLPEIKNKSFAIRSFGERIAMNMPIQGTAADIIKLAMVLVQKELARAKLKTKLILQVHDELILDAPAEEAEQAKALLTACMENAFPLSVPLVSDVSIGQTWYDAK